MTLDGKTIMITGGTGSFGRKFVQTVLQNHKPRKLIVFSRDELKQSEMQTQFQHPSLRYFLGDIRESKRLERAMHGVDILVHAAALKQVPAAEYNPLEAVKTNILGASNLLDAAIDAGVSQVLALSTDKAVNPINLYGATKLCMEKILVQGNSYSGLNGTKFSCVRYGNVVGSRGSVIPVFLRQRETGKVTVTDERMTRFWITLEQGVALVLKALETMQGGEIFIPKIPSMNIMDLVGALAPDAKVEITGIRPGEKLHEVLVSEDEARQTVEYEDHFVIEPHHHYWWDTKHNGKGTKPADGFSYRSDTNPDKLSKEALARMVEGLTAA